MVAQKETLISYNQRAEQAKDQSQELIVRITKLQKRLNFQLWNICFPRLRSPKYVNQVLKDVKIPATYKILGPAEIAHASPYEAPTLPSFLKTMRTLLPAGQLSITLESTPPLSSWPLEQKLGPRHYIKCLVALGLVRKERPIL